MRSDLAVDESHRGKGLGGELVDFCERIVSHGVSFVLACRGRVSFLPSFCRGFFGLFVPCSGRF